MCECVLDGEKGEFPKKSIASAINKIIKSGSSLEENFTKNLDNFFDVPDDDVVFITRQEMDLISDKSSSKHVDKARYAQLVDEHIQTLQNVYVTP